MKERYHYLTHLRMTYTNLLCIKLPAPQNDEPKLAPSIYITDSKLTKQY